MIKKMFPLLISIFISVIIAKLYIPRAIVVWDESVSLIWSYKIYSALKSGDLNALYQATQSQINYPPLQSWFIGIPQLLSGFSIENSRRVTLLWLILGSQVLYLLSKMTDKKQGLLIGLLSLFFLLTSPMVLLHSSIILKELIGASLSLSVIYFYIKARQQKNPLFFIFPSLLLTMLTLTKYNYGILMTAVLAIEALINFLYGEKKLATFLSYCYLFFPLCLILGLWIFFPADRLFNKLYEFKFGIFNPGIFITAGIGKPLDYLLFYPRAIIFMYSASPLTGYFLLAALVLAVLFLKNMTVRISWLAVVLNLITATIHHGNTQERYIFTTMPFLFFIGAFIFVKLFKSLFEKSKKMSSRARNERDDPVGITAASRDCFSASWRIAMTLFKQALRNRSLSVLVHLCILLMGIKIIIDLVKLPNYVYSVGAYTLKSPLFNQPDYSDKQQWFNYDVNKWAKKLPPTGLEKPADVMEYIAHNVDLSKPIYDIGRANEFAPDYYNLVLALHKEQKDYPSMPYPSFYTTMEILSTSRFYTRDYQLINSWTVNNIRQIEKDPAFLLLGRKKFSELGIEVGIFTRKM